MKYESFPETTLLPYLSVLMPTPYKMPNPSSPPLKFCSSQKGCIVVHPTIE